MIKTLCKDPFRFFFPAAILCLLYASTLWITYALLGIGFYPKDAHANLFLGGFLYFMILGFLLTAIPRFTKSDFLSKRELCFSLLLILAVLVFYFKGLSLFFWASIFTGWIFFFLFGRKRFLKRRENPPFTFIFVAVGVVLGMLGSLFLFFYYLDKSVFASLEDFGKIFFYDGMVTAFILGVGGRLIPGILGFVKIVEAQREIYEKPKAFLSLVPIDVFLCLILFFLSLILRGMEEFFISYLLGALVITYFAFKYWRLHERVKTGKWHGRMIKLACFFLLLASWLLVFFDEYEIHIRHLIYIGSYCLITIMVASRVIVSHSSESLELEHRKFPYLVVGCLIGFAALTRATAIFMPRIYLTHLGYAGLVLFVAAILWMLFFSKRILS